MPIKQRTHEIVEAERLDDRASRGLDATIIGLIAVNIVAVVVESAIVSN